MSAAEHGRSSATKSAREDTGRAPRTSRADGRCATWGRVPARARPIAVHVESECAHVRGPARIVVRAMLEAEVARRWDNNKHALVVPLAEVERVVAALTETGWPVTVVSAGLFRDGDRVATVAGSAEGGAS
jgi:hypothetical protein